MLSKWVNVLLPYHQTVLAEKQDAQADLDDEKAKVTRINTTCIQLHICIIKCVYNKFLMMLVRFMAD